MAVSGYCSTGIRATSGCIGERRLLFFNSGNLGSPPKVRDVAPNRTLSAARLRGRSPFFSARTLPRSSNSRASQVE